LSILKVETIGDAYLVASGLPTRNGDRHAAEIASFSLDILENVERYKIPEYEETILKIRVGIHTGTVHLAYVDAVSSVSAITDLIVCVISKTMTFNSFKT